MFVIVSMPFYQMNGIISTVSLIPVFFSRLGAIQAASDSSIGNPLGCAFVTEPSDSKGLPGTVVCGVCGAVRRYSFILQARKFGTFSCEPCRKFISRILRARVSVKCSSGTGNCIHPPVLRWNSACPPEDRPSAGEVMTSRCKACWLKLALTGFRMRECDHDELRNLLPSDMMSLVPTAANRPEALPWAPNRGQVIRMNQDSMSKVGFLSRVIFLDLQIAILTIFKNFFLRFLS